MSSNEPLIVQAVYSFKGKNNDEVKLLVIIELVFKLNIILIVAYLTIIYIFIN